MKKKAKADFPLHEVQGIQIRRQYFVWIVYMYLWAAWMIVSVFTAFRIFDGPSETYPLPQTFFEIGYIFLVFCLPWVILSILNRFLFGKIVCVIREEGIYHKDGLTPWEDIREVIYKIDIPSRSSMRYATEQKLYGKTPYYAGKNPPYGCCHTLLELHKGTHVVLLHTPLYLLRAIKKQRPELAVHLSKGSIFALIAIPVGTFLLSLLIVAGA